LTTQKDQVAILIVLGQITRTVYSSSLNLKIRGLRVDLGEVENAIISCLKSGRSAVILSEHEGQHIFGEEFGQLVVHIMGQLIILVISCLDESNNLNIPTAFVPIESMPLTMSKKIDRQQLRARLSDTSQKVSGMDSIGTNAVGIIYSGRNLDSWSCILWAS
jgi:hypothetical protein